MEALNIIGYKLGKKFANKLSKPFMKVATRKVESILLTKHNANNKQSQTPIKFKTKKALQCCAMKNKDTECEIETELFNWNIIFEECYILISKYLRNKCNWNDIDLYIFEFVLRELYNNAKVHGCNNYGNRVIKLAVRLDEKTDILEIRITSPKANYTIDKYTKTIPKPKKICEGRMGLFLVNSVVKDLTQTEDFATIQAVIKKSGEEDKIPHNNNEIINRVVVNNEYLEREHIKEVKNLECKVSASTFITEEATVLVIKVDGRFEYENFDGIWPLFNKEYDMILCDLSQANYMDSTSYAVLIHLREKAATVGITSINPECRYMLERAQLERLFIVEDNINDTIEEMLWHHVRGKNRSI
ncbi:MAG: STAS domain-containing protein [Magnetococcales bacterium]|nr:STAS domain-containing protein [Magnetococcales bacterium]